MLYVSEERRVPSFNHARVAVNEFTASSRTRMAVCVVFNTIVRRNARRVVENVHQFRVVRGVGRGAVVQRIELVLEAALLGLPRRGVPTAAIVAAVIKLPVHPTVVKVNVIVVVLEVVVVDKVPATAPEKEPDGCVSNGVAIELPTAHLIVEIERILAAALLGKTFRGSNRIKDIVASNVPALRPASSDVKRAGIGTFEAHV